MAPNYRTGIRPWAAWLAVIWLSCYGVLATAETQGCRAASPGVVWVQVAGNQFTRYCPTEMVPESLVATAGKSMLVEFHNITDLLYNALDHSGRGVTLSQVYTNPPPSRVLFAPLTLPTEVIRIPSLRKRLIGFFRNVTKACLSEHIVFYVPYQQIRVPSGVEDLAEDPMSEIWVSSPSAMAQLVQRGVPADRLLVIPPSIDLEPYRAPVERAPLPLPSRCEFTVMAFAEGRWGGGMDEALAAYVRAFGTGPDPDRGACLAVLDVGRASAFDAFRSAALQVAQRERLPPSMLDNIVVAHADTARPDASVPRLMQAADLVLLTARDGVVGTLGMEAMAAGKVPQGPGGEETGADPGPGVASGAQTLFTTRWGAQAEAVTHGVTGYTLPCTEDRVTFDTPLAESDERAGLHVGAAVCTVDVEVLSRLLREARQSPQKVPRVGGFSWFVSYLSIYPCQHGYWVRRRLAAMRGGC